MNTHVDPIVIKRTVRQNVRDRSPIRPRSPLETYQYRVSKIKLESFQYLLFSRIFEIFKFFRKGQDLDPLPDTHLVIITMIQDVNFEKKKCIVNVFEKNLDHLF